MACFDFLSGMMTITAAQVVVKLACECRAWVNYGQNVK